MAVVVTPKASALEVIVEIGTDQSGNPIFRARRFNNVKPSATDQDVFDVAQLLGGLQNHPVNGIQRVNDVDLAAGV
ncbi:MAG: DUF1659 domain-containing protein [Firmicutes bacterium]|nr:DUF1659 domain-containing protein [Bacillota bacterium]